MAYDFNAEIDRQFMENVKAILGDCWPIVDSLMELEPDLVIESVHNGRAAWPNDDTRLKAVNLVDVKSPHSTKVQVMERGGEFQFHLSTQFGTLNEQQVAEILGILKRSKHDGNSAVRRD